MDNFGKFNGDNKQAPGTPAGPAIDGLSAPSPQQNSFETAAPDDPALATPSPDPPLTQPSSESQPAGVATAPQKKRGGTGKTILMILLVVLLAAGAGAAGWFVGQAQGREQGKEEGRKAALAEFQQEAIEDETESPDSEDEAQLQLGELKDPEYKNEELEGKIGEQITANDGLVLMVTNIERNFKVDDANYKLDDTKELVKVNFLLGNITKDKPKDLSSFSFRLENSRGAQLTPENIATYEGKFDTVKIDPGTQTKGSVIYAVSKDEKPLVFTRSQMYRITNQNSEVTTKINITIAE